jgi:glycosyltransferase involved in cell wall biosynthesis
MPVRVLQSFPHKIGADRICTTAWHQAAGVAVAGGEVTLFTGAVHRALPPDVRVNTTLARGRWRLPYRVCGLHALELHDWVVARALPRLVGEIDVVHVWPLAARRTLLAARRLGIQTVLERPNAHTRFAYDVVAKECERLGVTLPRHHEHAFDARRLATEEEEYRLADHLLCPSDFVVETFRGEGFSNEQLIRHTYGYDESVYYPAARDVTVRRGLQAVFVGVCAVRKGLHFALEAWLRSPASREGKLRIAGAFVPDYQAKLAPLLAHPSVEVLGHSDDGPALMRSSDILILPSIEEGYGLVCAEAMASGCVPLASDACTDDVRHGDTGLVHAVGDTDALYTQLSALHEDREQLHDLRARCLAAAPEHTWTQAGVRLVTAYEEAISRATSPAAV